MLDESIPLTTGEVIFLSLDRRLKLTRHGHSIAVLISETLQKSELCKGSWKGKYLTFETA